MTRIEELLRELDQEANATRRMLERVPGDRLAWKPHQKSMTLGQLALHIAGLPGAIAQASQQIPYPAPSFVQPGATSAAELVPTLERSLQTARTILGGKSDQWLADTWRVVDGDRELMAIPIGGMLRMLMLNHWYHHRGQLGVYLRELGVPLPSVYGPTADENPFATPQVAQAST
jgi:uncharacterized damage-inducible protein DinB